MRMIRAVAIMLALTVTITLVGCVSYVDPDITLLKCSYTVLSLPSTIHSININAPYTTTAFFVSGFLLHTEYIRPTQYIISAVLIIPHISHTIASIPSSLRNITISDKDAIIYRGYSILLI